MRIMISIIFLIFAVVSCTSSPKGKSKFFDGVEYLFIQNSDSLVVYAIVQNTVSVKDKSLSVQNISAEFNGKKDTAKVKVTEEMIPIFEGSYQISDKEKTCIAVYRTAFKEKNTDEITVKFLGKTNYGSIKKELPKKTMNFMNIADNNLFLRLIPMIEETAPTKLNFKMLVIRNAPFQGAYMPSSEDFRVIIHNKNDQKWNSAEGKMFMQVVGEVPPQVAGDYIVLEMEYQNNPKFNISGQNKMEFILPAMPTPTKVTFDYWTK